MSNNESTTEVWKPIPGWEQYYEASTHGRIRSLDRFTIHSNGHPYRRKGRILKAWLLPNSGHHCVSLYADNKRTKFLVHRLVLTTFVGEPPEGTEGCHNNGNPADNRLENLRWDTKKANAQDSLKHGTHFYANKTHCTHGHILESPNLVVAPSLGNRRNCLACNRTRGYLHNKPHLKPHFQTLADQYYAKIMSNHSAG